MEFVQTVNNKTKTISLYREPYIMQTITDLCGNTPLIKLNNIIKSNQAEICLKLERFNGGGSIKDRPAKYIIEQAEKNGLLKPGGTIIESSSGNFGIACAMIGAAKGYRVIMVVDPKITPTNRTLLQVYGAEVVVVEEKDEDGSYHKSRIAFANRLHEEIPNSFRPDQCFNLNNSEAHYQNTAPEILAQCEGNIDALVIAVSTGGQLGGFARYFNEKSPQTKIIAVEPVGSSIFGGAEHAYLLPGFGLSWTPSNIINLEHLHSIYKVPDHIAFLACRLLAKHEGILVGGSTGASLLVAMQLAQQLDHGKRVVIIAADSGERYLDTIYNDQWLQDRNLPLSCSVDTLYSYAKNLAIYSQNPPETANYKPHILQELEVLAKKIPANSALLSSILC